MSRDRVKLPRAPATEHQKDALVGKLPVRSTRGKVSLASSKDSRRPPFAASLLKAAVYPTAPVHDLNNFEEAI